MSLYRLFKGIEIGGRFRRLRENQFGRDVVVIMGGAGLAQAISLGIAPILTRLYSPAEYGGFALYASASAILAGLATARYDTAILISDNDRDASHVLHLSLVITCGLGIALLWPILMFRHQAAAAMGSAQLAGWLLLLPASLLASGTHQAAYMWANRGRRFRLMASSKIAGATFGAATSLIGGLSGLGAGGLILGTLASQIVSCALLVPTAARTIGSEHGAARLRDLLGVALRHRRFPLYSLPAEIANTAAHYAPVVLLGSFFTTSVVGGFSLPQRVVGLPLQLLGSSVTDVFRQRAATDFASTGSCRAVFLTTLKGLLLAALLPFCIFAFAAPRLFVLLFGEDWAFAGEYAQLLAPLFFCRLIAGPLSYVLFIAEKQGVDLVGNLVLFGLACTGVILGAAHGDPRLAIKLFSIGSSCVYLSYIAYSYYHTVRRSP